MWGTILPQTRWEEPHIRVRVRKEGAIHPLDRFAIDPIAFESFVAPGLGRVHSTRGAVSALTVHVHGHLKACFAVGIEADEDGVGAAKAHRVNGGLNKGTKTAFMGVLVGNEGGAFLARAGVNDGFDVDPDDKEASTSARARRMDAVPLPTCTAQSPWRDGAPM